LMQDYSSVLIIAKGDFAARSFHIILFHIIYN
jgi:hypothetical protein